MNRLPLSFVRRIACFIAIMAVAIWIPVLDSAAPPKGPRDNFDDPLPRPAFGRFGTTRLRAAEHVESVAWSPDGRHFASGHHYEAVHLWDAATGTRLATPIVRDGGRLVWFTLDRKRLVVAGHLSIHFIRLLDYQVAHEPAARTQFALALSADSKRLAFSGGAGKLIVYSMQDAKVQYTLSVPPREISALAFSPDGDLLASSSRRPDIDPKIRLFDMKTGKEADELSLDRLGASALVFADDNTLISSHSDKSIRFWDVAKRKVIRTADRPVAAWRLVLSPDRKLLASCDRSSAVVHLWNPATGKLIRTLPDCGGGVADVAFSPDSKKLLTGGSFHSLRVWDVATGKEVNPRPGHHAAVYSLQFSPDGKHLASRGADQSVRIWDVKTRKELHRLSLGETQQHNRISYGGFTPYPTNSLAYSPDGKTLAAIGGQVGLHGAPSNAVHLWDTSDFTRERHLRLPKYWPLALAFTPDSKSLATVRGTGEDVRLWDVARADWHTVLADPNQEDLGGRLRPPPAIDVSCSSDGRTLAVASQSGVVLWNWPASKYLQRLTRPAAKGLRSEREVFHVRFSPDARLVASAAWQRPTDETQRDRIVFLHEVATGSIALELPNVIRAIGPAALHSVAFSPNGRMLAVASSDGLVRVWDVFAQKQLAAWKGHEGAVMTVAFSPDGRTLASGGVDTTILLWDASKLQVIRPEPTKAKPESLVADLALKDATKGYRAVWALVGHADAVNELKRVLRPVPKLDRARVKTLIEQLDSEEQKKRDEASAALERIGRATQPSLRAALAAKPSLEVRRRLDRILARFDASGDSGEELTRLRGVLALELSGSPSALSLLKELATGEPDAALTQDAKAALVRAKRLLKMENE